MSKMSFVTCLAEKFLTEENLNNCIGHCKDLHELLELLEIKRVFINKKQQNGILFPIKGILETIDITDINFTCSVLEKSLLVQKDDSQFIQLCEFVDLYIDRSNLDTDDLNVCSNLVTTVLKVCEHQNKTVDLQNFGRLFGKMCSSENRQSGYYFCMTVFPRYLKYSKSDIRPVKDCLFLALEKKNLELLCFLSDILLCSKYEEELLILLDNSEFWLLIQNTLTNTTQSFIQKQAAFILQRLIDYIILGRNTFPHTVPEVVKLATVNTDDTIAAWKNYFILLDISKEKQLHLIEPSLQLLNKIFYLHHTWIVCIFRILFYHSQSHIVFASVKTLLKSEWLQNASNFRAIALDLLVALNRIEYFILSTETYRILLSFINSSDSEVFILLLEESCKVAWSPIILWVFFKAVCNKSSDVSVPTSLIENILHSLHKLPQKYIREGCIQLFSRFLVRRCYGNKFVITDLIKIANILLDIEEHLFLDFCNVFKDIIWENRQHIFEKPTPLEVTEENVVAVLEFARPCQCNTEMENLISCADNTVLIDKLYIKMFSLLNEEQKELLSLYIQNRITDLDPDEDIVDLKLLVRYLGADKSFCKTYESEVDDLGDLAICILENAIDYNIRQHEVAFEVIANIDSQNGYSKEILPLWITEYKSMKNSVTEGMCISILKLYFIQLLENTSMLEQNTDELCVVIETAFELQHNKLMLYVFEQLPQLLRTFNVPHLLNRTVSEIVDLKKTSFFKTATEKFLESLVKNITIFDNQKERFVEILNTFLELSNSYEFIASLLGKQIKILASENPEYVVSCGLIMVELLIEGVWSRKEHRSEYNVCKAIERELKTYDKEYTFIDHHTLSRLHVIEAVLLVLNNKNVPESMKTAITDRITELLIEKYKINFNKRYFPDSLIHLQKLRIVQALLVLEPHIKNKRQSVVDLITSSFICESHQFCVKQIMQWLLICLLQNEKNTLSLIKNCLESAIRTRVSTISAFVPVLYHLTVSGDCFLNWEDVRDVILPWTMGAHFKLRLYAQVALAKLYEQAQTKSSKNPLQSEHYLYQVLQKVLQASGNQLNEVLQTDKLFFDYFHPSVCYSLQTIYYDIPRLNNVIETEWSSLENMDIPDFGSINGRNRTEMFSEQITNILSNKKTVIHCDDEIIPYINLQKKITPWKMLLEDQELSKQIGDFVLVASLVDKPANLGGLARTCEVFGVKQLVLNDAKIRNSKEFKSLSMSSEDWLDITEVKVKDLREFLMEIKQQGYTIVGAEQTSESVKLDDCKFPKKSVLLLGNEKEGIPPTLLPIVDICVEIPQLGLVRSLNVHVAGAIFIWEYVKQFLKDDVS